MKVLCSAVASLSLAAAFAGVVPAFEEGKLQTVCEGAAVKSFGGAWIYQGAPDIADDTTFQAGNANAREKVAPKSSKELKSNYFGVCSTRMPCLFENIELPEEAIHLIDGDDQTCWMSEAQPRSRLQPAVVRIDLPLARKISKVVLRKRPLRPDTERRPTDRPVMPLSIAAGRGTPVEMKLELATDACSWKTVFEGATGDTEENETVEISFEPTDAKQILVTATALRQVEFFMYSFSLAEIEVCGEDGVNRALASKGATIAVNSTRHCEMPYPSAQRLLWPAHWDLGVKWVRIGYHDDPINWHRVERVKGVLDLDPLAEESVKVLAENGINVIFCLDFGNRLYSGPEKRQFTQLPEWNWCMPNPPTTPEALEGWERYVEYMVGMFKGCVHTWEIWNEWTAACYWGDVENPDAFAEIVRRTVPIIRRLDPDSKIMLGSVAAGIWGLGKMAESDYENYVATDFKARIWKMFAKDVDAVGYHPFYNATPGWLPEYADDIAGFRKWLGSVGFAGTVHASEWNVNGRPTEIDPADAPAVWCGIHTMTEFQKAKLVAQVMALHAAYGQPSCFCEMYSAFYAQTELSLFKGSLLQDPVSPIQPTAAYYALRNLATAMDGFEPTGAFCARLGELDGKTVHAYPFADGERKGVAVWWQDCTWEDGYRQIADTLEIGVEAKGDVVAYDPVNGVRQVLDARTGDGKTLVEGLMLSDSPLFIVFD